MEPKIKPMWIIVALILIVVMIGVIYFIRDTRMGEIILKGFLFFFPGSMAGQAGTIIGGA